LSNADIKEAVTKRLLVQHVETVSNFEAVKDVLESYLVCFQPLT